MNPKWSELLDWVNDAIRTLPDLQAASGRYGLSRAGGLNANRLRLQGHIATKPQGQDCGWLPAGWVPPVRTITVTNPAGGNMWPIGDPQTVTWISVGIAPADLLNIEIARDGGPFTAIANNVPNSGSHNWAVVTGPATANAIIRVSTVAAPAVSGQSAAAFTVSQPARRGPLAGNPFVRGAALLGTGVLGACILLACILIAFSAFGGKVQAPPIPGLPTSVVAATVAPTIAAPVAPATAVPTSAAPVAPPTVAPPTAAPAMDKHGLPDYGFANQADLKQDNPSSPTLSAGQVGFVWGSHVFVNGVDQGRQAYFLMTPGTYGQLKVQDGAVRWYNLGSAAPAQFKEWAQGFITKYAGSHNWGELLPAATSGPVVSATSSAPVVEGEYRSEVGADNVRFFSKKAHALPFNGTNFGTFEDGSDPAPCGKYKVQPGQVAVIWWQMTLGGRALGGDNYTGQWLQPGTYDICGAGRIRVWSFNADAGVPSLYEPWWEHKVELEAGRAYTWLGRLRR